MPAALPVIVATSLVPWMVTVTFRLAVPSLDTAVKLSVRPEDVHVRPADEQGENHLPGTVTFVRDLGASIEITVQCFGEELLTVTTPRARPDAGVGDPVSVELPAAATVVFLA